MDRKKIIASLQTPKAVKWFWIVVTAPFALLLLLLLLTAAGLFGKLPSFEELENPKSNISTEIYSEDGQMIGSFYVQNRSYVDYDEISPNLVAALISTEDSRFYSHSGIDFISLARVGVKTLALGNRSQGGGSTITQQLAKNTLFTQEKHLARKAAEMFAALAIEKQYNKEQIFEMYVNTIYFGSGHYGIGEAAQGYFGKTPLQLTDAEAVMLAGLPNAPSAYSPNSSPDLAVKRMQVVLNRMVGCKKLTREQADALAAEAVTLQFLPAS